MTNQTEPQPADPPVQCTAVEEPEKPNYLTVSSCQTPRRIGEHWSNVRSCLPKQLAEHLQAIAHLLRVPIITVTSVDGVVSAAHLTTRCYLLVEKESQRKRDEQIRKNKEQSLDITRPLKLYNREMEELIRVKKELEIPDQMFGLMADKLATFRLSEMKFDAEQKKMWVKAVADSLWSTEPGSEGKRLSPVFHAQRKALFNQHSGHILEFLQRNAVEYKKLEIYHSLPYNRKNDHELMCLKKKWRDNFLHWVRSENRRYYEVSYFSEKTWAEIVLLNEKGYVVTKDKAPVLRTLDEPPRYEDSLAISESCN
ncbi:hypothetical protein BZA77DRAFT_349153 [Pyronema omphalodes]|nr:hypothetical protein BZA77DRAFT_349153 [Pyronema omphalodes]